MAKLDQAWYELAADTIQSNHSTPDERIDLFNDLWCAYTLCLMRMQWRSKTPIEQIRIAFEDAIQIYTGVPLQQILDYAKEIKANGTNETNEAAADSE